MTDKIRKIILHPNFGKTIKSLKDLKIKFPAPTTQELDFKGLQYPKRGKLITLEDNKQKLFEKKGEKLAKEYLIGAYDESINQYTCLEGMAFLTSHVFIIHGEKDFLPITYLSFGFYTRSRAFINKFSEFKYSENPQSDFKKNCISEKTDLLIDNVPENSILFIDGPLVGGQATHYTNKLNDNLLKKKVIPLFFVKNSSSNLVTDNVASLKGRYNSDMHWSHTNLKPGERTNFFQYTDQDVKTNAKVFCYLKAMKTSPQRVELHTNTFKTYKEQINSLMDLVYYLMLVQGSFRNPQIRSIAIAEKYARETLKLIDFNNIMRESGATPTMNQDRFAWG